MNGNRGAKGSIKDRIISMLYRIRYNKEEEKKEAYRLENREKKEKYLNNLNTFKDRSDVNVLPDEDKSEINKLTYNVNYKTNFQNYVNEKDSKSVAFSDGKENKIRKQIIYYNTKKVGLACNDDLDIQLSNIEFKNSNLDKKVNIKKEIKKTKNEINILKEVNKFISDTKEKLDFISEEIQDLKTETKNKYKTQEELELRYIKLKEKLCKLKLQYDAIKDKYDLSDFKVIESIKLMNSIDDYKQIAKLNEMEMLVNICKDEIAKIDNITLVKQDSNKVGENIEKNKKDQYNVKVKFNLSKEKINNLDSYKNEIIQEINNQKKIIDDMYKKAFHFKKSVEKKYEYVSKGKMLSSILKIAGGIITLPLSGLNLFGIALGSTLVNKGLKQINNSLEKREKIIINYNYEDISKQVSKVEDKVNYIDLILSDSLNEIKKLKNYFNDELKKYNEILPEYKDIFEKINAIENNLVSEQNKINNMNEKLNIEKEANKIKMKKLENK
ncbi:MAG: hypothetical protein Q4E75_00160 [bacterium]|nr:hypothetical protein [bacterium]